jgi:hypothetical protein
MIVLISSKLLEEYGIVGVQVGLRPLGKRKMHWHRSKLQGLKKKE